MSDRALEVLTKAVGYGEVVDPKLYASHLIAALRDAGIALVELPDLSDIWRRGISVRDDGIIFDESGEEGVEVYTPHEARELAEDLLAASFHANDRKTNE